MTRNILFSTALVALLVAAKAPASADTDLGCAPRQAITNIADTTSLLETARRECPLLGRIIEEFALQDLGEAFPSFGAMPAPREMIAVAAVAASGDADAVKHHARNALDAGATTLHLRKMLYLTALRAGVPQAIEATRALADLLGEGGDVPEQPARAGRPL